MNGLTAELIVANVAVHSLSITKDVPERLIRTVAHNISV